MRMEEEILEGYGEAEEEGGEEQNEKPLVEHNDQAHDSSIEIIGRMAELQWLISWMDRTLS